MVLSQNWLNNLECPWGLNCNFAHGENKLKFRYTTLSLMENSGQIPNAYTYINRPCLTFLSTGACPFGRRCTAIHDPRIQGPMYYPAWLPVAISRTNAQVIVDPLASQRECAVHQENPVISQSIWQHCRPSLRAARDAGAGAGLEFEDTYALVCNIGVPVFGSNETRFIEIRPSKVTELQKLCIVSCLLQSQDESFLFSPTHSLHGELCMIIQCRYFILCDVTVKANVSNSNVVMEISHEEYKARNMPWSHSTHPYTPCQVVVAQKVAFAPKGDSNCNFSIWFDHFPVKLEQSQVKRARRMKQKNKTAIKTGHTRPNANGALISRTSPVDFRCGCPGIEPFVLMIPAEESKESKSLIESILEHRIDSIIMAMGSPVQRMLDGLLARKLQLKKDFDALNLHHQVWIWPRREGLSRITHSTQAPPGNAIIYKPMTRKDRPEHVGLMDISNLWESFVTNISADVNESSQRSGGLPVFRSICRHSEEGGQVPQLPCPLENATSTWKQVILGHSGEWSTARELYEAKARDSAPDRNLPLSTIPFVQN